MQLWTPPCLPEALFISKSPFCISAQFCGWDGAPDGFQQDRVLALCSSNPLVW